MADGTPESEFSIECFQNYSAPEVFIQGLAGMVNQTDVEAMIRAQKQMLQRFEKTNEMLTNCNALSASRLKQATVEFKKHTQLLLDMKKDLDVIFKKIRLLKTKLSTQYPEAYEKAQKAALSQACLEEDEDEFNSAKQQSTSGISKSTETLRPSISQVFSESVNSETKPCTSESIPDDMKMDLSGDTPQKRPKSKNSKKSSDAESQGKRKGLRNSSSSSENSNSGESSDDDDDDDTG